MRSIPVSSMRGVHGLMLLLLHLSLAPYLCLADRTLALKDNEDMVISNHVASTRLFPAEANQAEG